MEIITGLLIGLSLYMGASTVATDVKANAPRCETSDPRPIGNGAYSTKYTPDPDCKMHPKTQDKGGVNETMS